MRSRQTSQNEQKMNDKNEDVDPFQLLTMKAHSFVRSPSSVIKMNDNSAIEAFTTTLLISHPLTP